MGRAKRARRLGSSAGEFTGDEFMVFFFGEMRIGATARRQTSITGHEPQSLGHGPLFGECHFAESLNLNGMEWLELHGEQEWGFRSAYVELRGSGVTGPPMLSYAAPA